MLVSTQKLLSISSPKISELIPQLEESTKKMLGCLMDNFYNILAIKNGFYAFESALHFSQLLQLINQLLM